MRITLDYTPHLKQALFHYLSTRDDIYYILLSWGVRSGKSTAGVYQITLEMLRSSAGIIVGPDDYTCDSLWEKVNKHLKDLISYKVKQKKVIELINGHRIEFKVADDPDKIISKGYEYAILDEGGKMEAQVWWNLTQRWQLEKKLRI